jgi:5-methylcytosine-specific restriction endonuclease McrA
VAISPSKRQRCYERDGFRCAKCGSGENLTVDHIIPKSRGGKNWLKNLQTLCQPCNQQKGQKVAQYSNRRSARQLVAAYRNHA